VIPTAVAREARTNLLDYLQTTYGLKDQAFETALLDFLRGPDGLFRGPYLDVRLPFRRVAADERVPLEIQPGFLPYRHQMRAFERLHGMRGHQPQPTLVTTGTGSGKTECFLYPVLDHCYREQQQGRKGIKAILLYPMNALATDQARRLAQILWDDERLRGKVTAGLYVGGKGSSPVADRDHLVDDRAALRQSPPDILLTNYKMLDFLLLRPEDQVLWQDNAAETLRFLVLDELHTYDGAQGSDVACLIRRLKARLGTPDGGLCCVGTSATIGEGDEASKQKLTKFAKEIFDDYFPTESVITEDRATIEEAIGQDRSVLIHPGEGDRERLEPRGKDLDAWLEDQKRLWLGEEAAMEEPLEVGSRLRRHDFLHLLLQVLESRVRPLEEVQAVLAKREPWFRDLDPAVRSLVLDSFVGLVSHARSLEKVKSDGTTREAPFLTVQVQVWLREIRALLRSVSWEPEFEWRSERGGRSVGLETGRRFLPMIRCTDCGCSGFGALQPEGKTKLRGDRDGESVGRAWMKRSPEVRFVLLGHAPGPPDTQFPPEYLCPACLTLGSEERCACSGGDEIETLPVRVARELTRDAHPRFRPICPDCGGEDSLMFLGSRAASLLSVAISHLYQSQFNEDRKLLAFVDSVQDASHRAGFFGARTYRFNLRALIQELLQEEGEAVPLEGFAERLLEHTAGRLQGERMAVPVLLPEDLRAHPDFEDFLKKDGKGEFPALRAWMTERLQLEVTFEYGYDVRAGRSLEKTGCSTLLVDPEAMEAAAADLAAIVSEDGFLESRQDALSEEEALLFLSGLVNRIRLRGGIHHSLLRRYAKESGNRWQLSRKMNPTGPVFGRDAVLPRFLLKRPPRRGTRSVFDAFGQSPDRVTWYRDWASRSLGLELGDDGVSQLYEVALERLVHSGVLASLDTKEGAAVWGLNPGCLAVTDGVQELICSDCREVVRLPAAVAARWAGGVCTRYRCGGHWGAPQAIEETFYTRIFREGRVARVFAEEHTGLLGRQKREQIEEQFKAKEEEAKPNAPNLLVCTPTLEMGIDIGDLSSVLLCAVPPLTSNYLQRIGRAGRSTGNALCLTMATNRPHDLYFHADPQAMMGGEVDPPGCFLDAPEMLKRQLVAFAMDAWAKQETEVLEIPRRTTAVLVEGAKFPARFLDYYEAEKEALVAGFQQRFGEGVLSERAVESLRRFALSGEVRERVLRAFEDIALERKRLRNLQESARKRIAELEKNPDSAQEDARAEIEEAQDSLRMLSRMYADLGLKYPLNVLTDAGVLPNYAFPEPGVELDSVVRVETAKGTDFQSYQYMRPASAAIRELAPFNTFYAEGRRVRVDEIDLGSSAEPLLETWRLCSDCNHAEREEGEESPETTCVRCGSESWSDVSRKRKLIYFRRSRSLAGRLEAATADDGEERHREIYQTADLIDVQQENWEGARLIRSLPFGMELLCGLKLRELNFGLDVDASFSVAGAGRNAGGFEVCRDCGRVRLHPRDEIRHAATCRVQRGQAERLEQVFLYREVESEAIRLLLPVADLDLDMRIASFRGALEMGLRRRFGGRAPHLQLKSMAERDRTGGARHYLVLFDTVPGGTGFLPSLWEEDSLLDMLEDTARALKECSCRARGRDGCYRCVYAFQNQRDLEHTSNQAALQILEQILEKRHELEDVDTLSEVVLDSCLESELEEKFLRVLNRRLEREGSTRKTIRKGQERRDIETGGQRWTIRPQVDLGPSQGVAIPCRPDFMIEPWPDNADARPIAVFCDGFAFHVQPEEQVSRLGDDIRKRRAILESGRYLVWTITWKDVSDFEERNGDPPPTLLAHPSSRASAGLCEQWRVPRVAVLAERSNMELLWEWMRNPSAQEWRREISGLGARFLLPEARTSIDPPSVEEIETEVLRSLSRVAADPPRKPVMPETKLLAQIHRGEAVDLMARLATATLAPGSEARTAVWSARLFDDPDARRSRGYEASWRQFWQAVNFLQFADGLEFASTEDLQAREAAGAVVIPFPRPDHGYSLVADTTVETEQAVAAGPLEEEDDDLLLPEEQALVQAAVDRGFVRPAVGWELPVGGSRCGPEAQLAWPEAKVAYLEQPDPADLQTFLGEGWAVFSELSQQDDLLQVLGKRSGRKEDSDG
jgi:DEAD/DEAH box helicase domain-containing protein